MQRDLIVKSRSLGGTSDLTLLAPIKPGFVDSLESVTYKTRVKRVLDTLHAARVASHEYALARLLSDAVERVGAIHSVRVAVLEPEDKVLLAVTFDGTWQSYIRVLWEKVGSLLDLIFCNTVDYVSASDHTFSAWLDWAGRVQVETGFFYGPPDSTARDTLYHRRIERTRERGQANEVHELRAVLPTAEEAVARMTRQELLDDADELPPSVARPRMGYERFRNGFQGLAALYRLTDFYRPGTADGTVLRIASLSLLKEFVDMWNAGLGQSDFDEARGTSEGSLGRFKRQLDWLLPESEWPIQLDRPRPEYDAISDEILQDVQGGILRPYADVSHGALLMISLDSTDAAATFLELLEEHLTVHGEAPSALMTNVGLTPAGLRKCGLSEDEIDLFPEEFRQGMAERAGLLGDLRNNHPRRWRLPQRLVDFTTSTLAEAIDLGTVHAVLQLRAKAVGLAADVEEIADPQHPLHEEVGRWTALESSGIRVLALQTMKRQFNSEGAVVEHFGYADGGSEPSISDDGPPGPRIHLGEIVVGYNNAADDAHADSDTSESELARLKWTRNGSFLVVRKYRQFVDRLDSAVGAAAGEMAGRLGVASDDDENMRKLREEIYAKLVGRRRDGEPLIAPNTPGSLNDFDYSADPNGKVCPLHAHIRRSNPRLDPASMARPPHIARRSMPYGPPRTAGEADRGLVFMAYNASLGEQFEVVQRWLIGGNSTGASSGPGCPIVGVAESGFPRHFRFEDGSGEVINVELEPGVPVFQEPLALTRLEWGLYLFAPSLTTVRRLRRSARAAGGAASGVPWNAVAGRQQIASLLRLREERGDAAALRAWKAAMEDAQAIDRLESAGLLAAIREDHGGVLRTPYGVIVASRDLALRVFLDREERYSVSGQLDRMEKSIGKVFLGMDAGDEYASMSGPVNEAIMALDPDEVFRVARKAAERRLCAIRDLAHSQARDASADRYEAAVDSRELVDEVLAALTESWFGLQDSPRFKRGSADWLWQQGEPPIYPGHFTALSRYMFQPHPGEVPTELARSYGVALEKAMLGFVADQLGNVPMNPDGKPALIAKAIFAHPQHGKDPLFVARTMTGVIMGFTPTIIGAVLNVIREWYRDGAFWALRARTQEGGIPDLAAAHQTLRPAMSAASRMRPMPQIAWRTARKPDRLGPPGHAVDVEVGDKIVIAIASGTQQSLVDAQSDGRLMFGGNREANPHPTHACPGYHAGIAAMLGTLTALLTWEGEIRQGASALAFDLRGPVERGDIQKLQELHRASLDLYLRGSKALEKFRTVDNAEEFALVRERADGLILAWGDSWLDYRDITNNNDLVNSLNAMGYKVNEGRNDSDPFCNYEKWLLIRRMAAEIERPPPGGAAFLNYITRKIAEKPRAILLSGGGNDSVEDKLLSLLLPKSAGQGVLDTVKLTAHMDDLLKYYVTIVDAIHARLGAAGRAEVPILVHGYDYPLPFSSMWGDTFGRRKWLQEPFLKRGYRDSASADLVDLSVATPAMETIIDAFNERLEKRLTEGRPYVRYVNLRNTLRPQWDDDRVPGWNDNLHANVVGFTALAKKVAAAIELTAPVVP